MNESDVKPIPVAWTSKAEMESVRNDEAGIMAPNTGYWRHAPGWDIPLYGQSAINRLTAERNALAADASRLQFCVNHDSFPTLARNGKTWVLFMRTTANRRSSFFGTTPTEAIDKAMAKEATQ